VSRNASDVFRDSLPAATAARAPGGTTTTVFVALTDDAAMREAIDAAVAGRGSAIVTATAEAFADQLVAHAGGVAILDLACVPTSSPIFIERLRGQFPGLVLVTAGTAREQSALAPLVADGTVCRFAHKPVSGQRLGLFLDAALRRRDALDREQRDVLLAPLRATRSRTSRAAVSILLLAVAIGSAAWLLHRPEAPPAPVAQDAVAPAAADAALLVAPAFAPLVIPGDIATAPIALEPAAPADADAPAAPQPAPVMPAMPAAVAPDDVIVQARHEAQLARRLMDVGLLIDPPGNNARSHIAAATHLAPADAEVRRTARALSGRLVAATRSALLAHDAATAERWLDAARSYGVNAATIAELDEQLSMLKGMLGQ
jgi:DNA-binding NarL/FixJ family response regulator